MGIIIFTPGAERSRAEDASSTLTCYSATFPVYKILPRKKSETSLFAQNMHAIVRCCWSVWRVAVASGETRNMHSERLDTCQYTIQNMNIDFFLLLQVFEVQCLKLMPCKPLFLKLHQVTKKCSILQGT